MQNYVYCRRWCRKTRKKELPVQEQKASNALQFLPLITPAATPLHWLSSPERRSWFNQGGCSPVVCCLSLPPVLAAARSALRGSVLWQFCSSPAFSPAPRLWLMLLLAWSQTLCFPLLSRMGWLQPLLMLLPKWRLQSSSRLLTATYWITVEYIYKYVKSTCTEAVIFWLSQQM